MTQLKRRALKKRTLTAQQRNQYNEMIEIVKRIKLSLQKYPNDKYIQDIDDDLTKKYNDMLKATETYLNTPVEEIITYEIDGDIESIKEALVNFTKLMSL